MPTYSRRTALRLSAGISLAGLFAGTVSGAQADEYPSRPVKIIVPFGVAGPTDVYTRDIAQELQEMLHQAFVIENRPGGGTTIGTEFVANAAPDGYTLLMVSGTQTVNETLYRTKSYQLLRDLAPVAPLIDSDLVLVVHPSVPANNLAELIALAKAKPGTLNYGSSGLGSNYHMAGELLRNITGIDIVHVPYKGSSGMRSDIISGQIQLMFDSLPTMAPFIKSEAVRAMGTSGKTRSTILPDVPTLDEAGAPGFEASLWVGFMAPKNTPQPVIDLLNHSITSILQRPELRKKWEDEGATALVMTQPQFATFMQAEIVKWAKVIKDNHIPLVE